MFKIKNFIKNIPYLPFLYGMFPVLFLFAHNISEVKYKMLWLPLFAVIFVVLISVVILSVFVKDYRKSGLILSLFFLFFLSYGNFKELLLSIGWLADMNVIRDKYLYPLGVLFFGSTGYFIIRSSGLRAVYRFFKTMGYLLIVFSLVNIGASAYSNRQNGVIFEDSAIQVGPDQNQNLPDIYYIIPDSYGRADMLKEVYGYDNGEFVDFLEEKGFSVLSDSKSNYQNTILSLSATLNMDYLEDLTPETIGDNYFMNMIQNNRVQQFLKERGYKIINFNSGYGMTSYNKYADINLELSYLNSFSRKIIKTSMLKYLINGEYLFRFNIKNEERKRILKSMEELKEIPEIDGPKFALLHLKSPHTPFLFDRNGGEVGVNWRSVTSSEAYNRFWLDQLIFISGQLSSAVEEILAKSKNEPIIIIQSDHGPEFMTLGLPDEFFQSDAYTKLRIRNFSAFYLPGGKKTLLPDDMTNVNTFRFIFKNYFNAERDLLEDKVYGDYDFSLLKRRSDTNKIKRVSEDLF